MTKAARKRYFNFVATDSHVDDMRPKARQRAASMKNSRPKLSAVFKPPRTISNPDFLDRGSDVEFRETIYAYIQGAGRMLTCREAFGRSLGLTASQFAVLIGVAYRQGHSGVTVRDLSKHIALAATHVTTEIGRLVDKGLLTKRPNESDRRSVLVSLSKAGEKAVMDISPFVRSINDMLFTGIPQADLEVVKNVARKLVANSEYVTTELDRQASKNATRNRVNSR
jgi:DNA-binding MarR family transcriptional regulator